MKNLKLYSEVTSNLALQSENESILFCANDIEGNRLFFASSANIVYTTHLSQFQDGKVQGSLQAEIDPIDLEEGDFITAFDFLLEKEALIVGTSSGILLLHSVDGNGTEVVGRVEGGVQCVSPSPDGDLLGVTTGFGQLLVMTHDWELLYEMPLEDVPEGVDVNEPDFSGGDVFASPISWRGDGKYFSTMSAVSQSAQKKVKVWERDTGVLHASSESKPFMGAALEWMPSGAKIAAVYDRKVKNKGPSIVFFERNGLQRSSFDVNEPVGATVELLKWNCSSDLLAAVVRSERFDFVKIWSFSNNHWYLKHEIRYSSSDGVRFMWDPTKPYQLICWTLAGQITIYKLIWVTAVNEDSTAFVIDGSKILVTPLSVSLMPPPLYSFSLNFPSAVRDMSLYSKNSKSRLAAFLSDGSLCAVELPPPDSWEELDGKDFNVEASSSETEFGSFVHFSWLDSHVLLAVSHFGFSHSNCLSQTSSKKDGKYGLYTEEVELVCSEDQVPGLVTGSGWHAKVSNQSLLDGLVVGLASNPAKSGSAFVQFEGGKVMEYAPKLGIAKGDSKQDNVSFPSSCPWMSTVLVGNPAKPLVFGLDDMGKLLVGGRLLCSNCSSFSFYSNLADHVTTHLVITTKQDLLFIVDVSDILNGESDLTFEKFIHTGTKRREEEKPDFINIWERGAKVIGVLQGDEAGVMIQTTRGNVECIYPRKLVLSSIVHALVQRRFRDALLMVRRHRIDFNVMVDYSGLQSFVQSASEFVRQVNNLSYITEFVCALNNENVTQKLYKKFLCLPGNGEDRVGEANFCLDPDADNKVRSVLLAMKKALEEQLPESPARELCILTTLARSDPPALEEALERVKVIREMELSGSDDPRKITYPSSEGALKHLLWLSDSDAVFEAALGLYDLNLAAIVALNSQRDPKEFLPFLQDLERMPAHFMRYNIDLKLRRFEKALKHIVSAGDAHFDDTMNLMKKNPQLFPLGHQLITDPAKRSQVLEAWGDQLTDEKCFEDAAATYLCCSSLENALKAYRACGNWSGVMTVAGLLKMESDEVLQLAHELREELQALGKPAEAAKIALEYCRDISAGVNLLISAREWEEALRIALMHRKDDLISEVKNASLECASTLIDEYKEGLEKVGKYLARYLAVRQRRLLLAAKLQAEERSVNDLDDDTASETSSTFSGMSAYTTGSRKSSAVSTRSTATSNTRQRQRQRKQGKIRPGSAGEEMALVDHLKGMSPTSGAKRELKSLLVSLVMLNEAETARKLQSTAENFQLCQMAAVKLAEETVSSYTINENAHTLERYVQKVKSEVPSSEAFSWRCKVFLSP